MDLCNLGTGAPFLLDSQVQLDLDFFVDLCNLGTGAPFLLDQPSSVGLRLLNFRHLDLCNLGTGAPFFIRSGKSSVGLGLFQVGLRARSDILDLSFLSSQMGCGLVSICRIDNEINKSV